jgi:cytidine deaminase
VLAEFCGPEMPVYAAEREPGGAVRTLTLGALLPDAFRGPP